MKRRSHLCPTSRGSSTVHHGHSCLENRVFIIDLNQFVDATGAIVMIPGDNKQTKRADLKDSLNLCIPKTPANFEVMIVHLTIIFTDQFTTFRNSGIDLRWVQCFIENAENPPKRQNFSEKMFHLRQLTEIVSHKHH